MGKYPKGECYMVKQVRRSYTKEFKTWAIKKVANSEKTLADVARNLSIHENLLRGWCKKVEEIEALPDTNVSKDDEIRRLWAGLESVRENEIPKKSAAYFARHQQ